MADYEADTNISSANIDAAQKAAEERSMASHSVLATRITARSFVSSDIILVKVGPEAQKFPIHEHLLVNHSTYFKDALRTRLESEAIPVVRLNDEDADAFKIIAAWLYDKYIVWPSQYDFAGLVNLVMAWRLAARLDIEECMNTIMDAIRHYLTAPSGKPEDFYKTVGADLMMLVDQLDGRSTEDSPLRRFFVDRFVWEMRWSKNTHLAGDGEPFRPDHLKMWMKEGNLVVDIMKRVYGRGLSELGEGDDPASLEGCQYHIHEQGSTCTSRVNAQQHQKERSARDQPSTSAETSGRSQAQPNDMSFFNAQAGHKTDDASSGESTVVLTPATTPDTSTATYEEMPVGKRLRYPDHPGRCFRAACPDVFCEENPNCILKPKVPVVSTKKAIREAYRDVAAAVNPVDDVHAEEGGQYEACQW